VLVVVASDQDSTAQVVVSRWAGLDAAQLSPRDLTRPGWIYDPDRPMDGAAVINGRLVNVRSIDAVVTRLSWVTPRDVSSEIAALDREYAASEISAFLLAWLTSLSCPVVNRPTPRCLAGPHRRPQEWVHTAAQLGIRVRPWRLSEQPLADLPSVSVVAKTCFGEMDDLLKQQAARLAEAAGATLLNVYFSSPLADAEFVSADMWPDLSQPPVAEALRVHLCGTGG
jgi:hypothetical protein